MFFTMAMSTHARTRHKAGSTRDEPHRLLTIYDGMPTLSDSWAALKGISRDYAGLLTVIFVTPFHPHGNIVA